MHKIAKLFLTLSLVNHSAIGQHLEIRCRVVCRSSATNCAWSMRFGYLIAVRPDSAIRPELGPATRSFPTSRLMQVTGVQNALYRCITCS